MMERPYVHKSIAPFNSSAVFTTTKTLVSFKGGEGGGCSILIGVFTLTSRFMLIGFREARALLV